MSKAEDEVRQSLQQYPFPPSHPSETPRVTTFIFSFQSLTLLLPGASHPLCPCGRGLVILPKCCAKPPPLGWLSHLGHLVPPAAHLGEGGEQSSLLTHAGLAGLATSSMQNNFGWKKAVQVTLPSPQRKVTPCTEIFPNLAHFLSFPTFSLVPSPPDGCMGIFLSSLECCGFAGGMQGPLAAQEMLCRGGCSAWDDDLAHPWGAVGHHGHPCPSNQCWPSQHDLLFMMTNQTGRRSVATGRVPPGLKTSSLSSQPQQRNSELGGDTRAKATARKDPLD